MDERLIASAIVGKTHGVEGFLRINSLSGEYSHLIKLKSCTLKLKDGKSINVSIDEVKRHSDGILMRFASCTSPEKARIYSGAILYIKRSEAPSLKKGEYYVADLFDLNLTLSSEVIGKVESVSDGAQAVYLNVRLNDGRLVLIPNMEPFVSHPDFDAGEIKLLMSSLIGK